MVVEMRRLSVRTSDGGFIGEVELLARDGERVLALHRARVREGVDSVGSLERSNKSTACRDRRLDCAMTVPQRTEKAGGTSDEDAMAHGFAHGGDGRRSAACSGKAEK